LFEAKVELHPHKVACVCESDRLTYADLNNRANRIAWRLKSLGVTSNSKVGILMERSVDLIAVLLAVFKAGGAYVPISTSLPAQRVQDILTDAGVSVLLTNIETPDIGGSHLDVVNVLDLLASIDRGCGPLSTKQSVQDLAYIIYTSGSTGRPKGVMVNQRALVNLLWSMRNQPGIAKDDVLLAVTSIGFDISALEIFLPLIVGATVVIASKATLSNPSLIGKAIIENDVTIMQATPANWKLLIDSGWEGLRKLKVLCGGDVLTQDLARQLLQRVGSLWNMYGPTETTIWSSVCRIQNADSIISIGSPIANTELYILDTYLEPTPIGVIGELLIGGKGVAKGYINQPELTSQKFIADHINGAGHKLYRTGDLARYLPDLSIEILGRRDEQVKLHGHRIELGEVRAGLLKHHAVSDAIVIVEPENIHHKVLTAYFVSKGENLASSDLRNFLRTMFPAYMVPTLYVQLPQIPLTANGKIDRSRLKHLTSFHSNGLYQAPRNAIEETLVEIWQAVLHLEQVGINDNFFDLGGASIQSLQVALSAELAGYKLSAESIFEFQTIAELAAQMKPVDLS
jgi:amino acid adenylation domain-containing protein